MLSGGGNPLASPFAEARRDVGYPESPLVVWLDLESLLAPGDPESALRFADEIAREVGYWLLASTGASDIEEAEEILWADADPDGLAVAFAKALQDRAVYSRKSQHLSAGLPKDARDPKYIHPDELPLLFLHVAWRLDVDARLVTSPIHRYVHLYKPGLDLIRGVEPTCFRRVDALGRLVHTDEPSVGRRLTFPPEHYPGGTGGVTNPRPLPPGAYKVLSPGALVGALFESLLAREGEREEDLEATLAAGGSDSIARLLHRAAIGRGIEAWERGDLPTVARYAEQSADLRAKYPGALQADPSVHILDAISALAEGDEATGLGLLDAIARRAPCPESEEGAAASWLLLERAAPPGDPQIVACLRARHRGDPARLEALCEMPSARPHLPERCGDQKP